MFNLGQLSATMNLLSTEKNLKNVRNQNSKGQSNCPFGSLIVTGIFAINN